MPEIVKLPKFGLTMQEALVSEWKVGVGERIEKGDVLAMIESEKVEMELPSPASGIVARYLVETGETVPVGSEVAVIVSDESELEEYKEEGLGEGKEQGG
jgi:pyruvate/2-oxoglutarate dehydrogenase complex dihydrolipoamide acyltransferase (E2) component